MTKTPEGHADAYLSIGDLAAATGISRDTIRVWERRYGRPKPVRLPSKHRRYTRDHVRWLRRVAEAMARGHRAGAAVRANDAELDEMLLGDATRHAEAPHVEQMLGHVERYDRAGLAAILEREWSARSPLDFLEACVAPLLIAVGRAWSDGRLQVRHEHFVSEVVQDHLRALRSGLPPVETGPTVLLTTMSGEQHGMGVQMAALLAAVNGVRTRVLGTETPREEILDAVKETGAEAVAISVSLSTGGVETDRHLADLRRELPDEVTLLIGGRGARGVRRGPRGVEYVDGLAGFDAWLKST